MKRSVSEYSLWLKKSTLVFFPEYTDHGPTHIADVLAACNKLITEEAYRLLSPTDSAALVLAVLLHDIALHLTQDGFCRLVRGETKLKPIRELGDADWPILWERFRAEATRFSGAKNTRMFGDVARVEPPPLDDWNWNNKQNLLVGEFIRRQATRPRLA